MLTHSLYYFAPTWGIVDTIPDMEDPNVDSYCIFFAQIFWHLLGLYDLMLERTETAMRTYMHTVFITYLWSLLYHEQCNSLI